MLLSKVSSLILCLNMVLENKKRIDHTKWHLKDFILIQPVRTFARAL